MAAANEPLGSGDIRGRQSMIAVIFEVWPKDGHLDDYLDIAHGLRPELEKIDGLA